MKKTKILVPALSILALGMAASVTGTVAWFTSNPTVSGSQIKISVDNASDLRIAKAHDGDPVASGGAGWVTNFSNWNVNRGNEAPLTPSSCIDAAEDYKTSTQTMSAVGTYTVAQGVRFIAPNTSTNVVKEDGTATTPIDATGDNSAYYVDGAYATAPYSLIYRGTEESVPVYYKVRVDAEAVKNIDKAVRIGILENDTTFVVAGLGNATASADETYYEITGQITLANDVLKNYDIFAWYEGTDSNCVNANAVPNELEISVKYSLVQANL